MPRANPQERKRKLKEKAGAHQSRAATPGGPRARDVPQEDTRGKVLLGVVLLEIIKNQPDRVNWCMKQIRTYLGKSSDLAFLKELYDFDLSTKPIPPPSETQVSKPS